MLVKVIFFQAVAHVEVTRQGIDIKVTLPKYLQAVRVALTAERTGEPKEGMHTTKCTWRGRIEEGSWIERGGQTPFLSAHTSWKR